MFSQRIMVIAGLAFAALVIGMGASCSRGHPRIVALSFEAPDIDGDTVADADADADADAKTLRSIRKVGGFYTVDYHGDYEERLQWLNDYHLEAAAKLNTASHCSLFATYTQDEGPLLGRNLDRHREKAILARFSAPGKYASFAFSPATEAQLQSVLGVARPSDDQRNAFLFCLPFYATDGINEKGLSIAIAGTPLRRVKPSETRSPMYVLLFIRRALDHCQNVEEVARLAETVYLYDKALDTISHHFIVTDASGRWLVIDYPDGDLRLTFGQGTSQARTNHFLEGGPAIDNTSFWRYEKLDAALKSPEPLASGVDAMQLLRGVQNHTAWSVVYESRTRSGLVAAGGHYRTLYRFGFPPAPHPAPSPVCLIPEPG